MKLKKAKDGINKVAVFMISDFGEVYTGVIAGTFVTVPKKGVYDKLTDVVGDLTRFTDIDDFYQEGLQSDWFTTKDAADQASDFICNVQSLYKECEVKYMILPVEVLYMNLKTKKAHDSAPTEFVIENEGSYLTTYRFQKTAVKEYVYDVQWSKNSSEATLFDNSAAKWMLGLLQSNIKNTENAKIIKLDTEDILDEKAMYIVQLLTNDQSAGYLFCQGDDCDIVDDKHDATWYSEEAYNKVWKKKTINDVLTDLIRENEGVDAAELKQIELGIFSHEFLRYYNKGAKTVNQARKMWEADHGKS